MRTRGGSPTSGDTTGPGGVGLRCGPGRPREVAGSSQEESGPQMCDADGIRNR